MSDAAVIARDIGLKPGELEQLDDAHWRLRNLYKVVTKDEEGADGDEGAGLVVLFKPNRIQQRVLARLHYRNAVLKARQVGLSTLIIILWLDTALFSKSPIRCGIVAHTKDAGEKILAKLQFAYDNLPEFVRAACPMRRASASEIEFAHNRATIRVATSLRMDTIHRLHVSEFGKLCAVYPDKAREVITGTLPTVPRSGIVVIESTAEGNEGAFHDLCMRALSLQQSGSTLSPLDFRLHFFAWHDQAEYRLEESSTAVMSDALIEYFAKVEARIGKRLSREQRLWYASTLQSQFAGESPLMWQEYPSFPEEAFQVSLEGTWYATQMALARTQNRIRKALPVERSIPVYTFWDLGRGDMTTIWLMQHVGPEYRFVGYYEASGEDLTHYVSWLQGRGLVFAAHYLPHEADARRLGKDADTNQTLRQMLQDLLPGQRVEVVPRITTIAAGIQQTRDAWGSCWFDEDACAQGIKRLQNYRKTWNKTLMRWSDEPMHDDNSHGADAFRQFGQKLASGERFGNAYEPPTGESGGPAHARRSKWGRRRGSGRPGMAA